MGIDIEKLITVIIPCYRSAPYLATLWESLKHQTIGIDRLNCVFVDDASTDDGATWDVLRRIHDEEPENTTILRLEENRRQGGARNAGLAYANTKWVQFVDADDWLKEDALEKLYNVAERYHVDLLQYGMWDAIRQPERSAGGDRQDRLFDIRTVQDRKDLLMSGCFNTRHNAKLYSTAILQKAGARFAENVLFEEPLFVYPQFFYVSRAAVLDEELYCWRYHDDNATYTLNDSLQLDHPKVQERLLDFLFQRHAWIEDYMDEVEYYILWTYYLETVVNAGRTPRQVLTPEYYCHMQQVIREHFPDWKKNPHINDLGEPFLELFEGIDRAYSTGEEIHDFCAQMAEKLKNHLNQ